MKRSKTNPAIINLISELKEKSFEKNAPIWKDLSKRLEKPNRGYAEANLSKIDRMTDHDDVVVVVGKVLGAGKLTHKVTISALNFSQRAKEKIETVGGGCLTLSELAEEFPLGTNVKIIG